VAVSGTCGRRFWCAVAAEPAYDAAWPVSLRFLIWALT
jgi:hypothetical protein